MSPHPTSPSWWNHRDETRKTLTVVYSEWWTWHAGASWPELVLGSQSLCELWLWGNKNHESHELAEVTALQIKRNGLGSSQESRQFSPRKGCLGILFQLLSGPPCLLSVSQLSPAAHPFPDWANLSTSLILTTEVFNNNNTTKMF